MFDVMHLLFGQSRRHLLYEPGHGDGERSAQLRESSNGKVTRDLIERVPAETVRRRAESATHKTASKEAVKRWLGGALAAMR